MPRRASPYGPRYQRERAALRGQPCSLRLVCDGAPSTSADHVPPLSLHRHVEGTHCCRLQPACLPCQHRQAQLLMRRVDFRRFSRPVPSRAW